jgi:arsenate reductase
MSPKETLMGASRKAGAEQVRVLVICTGNSARSQIAEALFRYLGGGRVAAYSAGSNPAPVVHPLAVRVMAEIGVDLSAHHPKPLTAYLGQSFDVIIAVCSRAAESCPAFPGSVARLNWFYDDPTALEGGAAERLAAFRALRDNLQQRIAAWLAENL